MLNALIFDFDGTIIDTEDAEYHTWQEVYARYGQELALSTWAQVVGTAGNLFDPVAHLEEMIGRPLPRDEIRARRSARDRALTHAMDARPGVREMVASAQRNGVSLAIASSSDHGWVEGHLRRLGLIDAFSAIACSDDTGGRGKPDPSVYLLALQRLGVSAADAVAIEDSPNGAIAATAAGVACVVVPNGVTRHFRFPQGITRLDSLEDVALEDIAREIRR